MECAFKINPHFRLVWLRQHRQSDSAGNRSLRGDGQSRNLSLAFGAAHQELCDPPCCTGAAFHTWGLHFVLAAQKNLKELTVHIWFSNSTCTGRLQIGF